MSRTITRGAAAGAGLIFHVFAQDSASTTGAGKASVAFGSWSCRYIRNGEAISGAITPEDITTIGTYAAPTANTNIRIKAVDNTNMIGVYEVQIHADWVNTTNSCQSLTIYLTATGVAVLPLQIVLTGFDAQTLQASSATLADVKTKTDFLPSATAGAAGGVFIAGTNAATTITTGLTTTFTGNLTGSVASVTGAVGSVTGNVGGNVSGSVGSVVGAVGSVTGAVGSVTGAVGSVTAGVTVSTNNDKTGYSLTQAFPANFASLGISAAGNANVDVIKINGVTVIGTGVAGDLWRA